MTINRRRLLQYTGASCALAALPAITGAATTLRRYQVQDAVAAPRFATGVVLVADTAVDRFAGPGLYLYPAWGQPRLYQVRARGDRLEFSNPGSGQLLWTQSAQLDPAVAGKVIEGPEAAPFLATYPILDVPMLPATA
jgi:hypothetical protein